MGRLNIMVECWIGFILIPPEPKIGTSLRTETEDSRSHREIQQPLNNNMVTCVSTDLHVAGH